jgi:hypothetical protein
MCSVTCEMPIVQITEMVPANQESRATQEVDLLGEGGSTGEIVPGQSLVFAVLEVCLCLLVRQLPVLNPTPGPVPIVRQHHILPPTEESGQLIAVALSSMECLPRLCSPQGEYP